MSSSHSMIISNLCTVYTSSFTYFYLNFVISNTKPLFILAIFYSDRLFKTTSLPTVIAIYSLSNMGKQAPLHFLNCSMSSLLINLAVRVGQAIQGHQIPFSLPQNSSLYLRTSITQKDV